MVHILVLDDNADLCKAMKAALEIEHYTVFTGRSGQDGMNLLMTQTFDAVICDVRMPEMSGLELLQQVRADPRWQHLLFIMTGGSAEDQAPSLAHGADLFLLKPVGMFDLLKRLKEHFESA
jgi:DNA-binding response OmpR family regulator